MLALIGISSVLSNIAMTQGFKALRRLITLSIVLSTALLLAGCTSLSSLFFYPQTVWISTPADAEVEYHDVWLTANDGTGLHAWWMSAQSTQTDSNVMLLYLHGNAENISSHSHSIYWLPKNGVSVLALDYRGFGASEGKALMPDVLQDIEAAAAWMKQQYPDKELIILGQSIGSALAINFAAQAASEYDIKALVLDAPFTGFPAVARSAMSSNIIGWFIWPFTVLVPNRWDPIKKVADIDLPVLIMHSPKDKVVPYKQGKKLYKHWQQEYPAQTHCWLESKGSHVMSFAFPELRQATLDFVRTKECGKQ